MGDTKHTPTPWEARHWTVVANGVVLLQTFATGAGPVGLKRAAANASLIVHAVNSLASHEARIADLEGALRSFMAASEEPDPESKSPRAVLLANAWAKARAVIAKAERKL